MTLPVFLLSLIPAGVVLVLWFRFVWLPWHDEEVRRRYRATPGVYVVDMRPIVRGIKQMAKTVEPAIARVGREVADAAERIANGGRS